MLMTATDLKNLRAEYRESLKDWQEATGKIQSHFATVISKSWQKSRYVARNLPFAPEQAVICPPHSLLNFAPNQQHRIDYGAGVFEGSSAEPMLGKNNKISGVNVILHRPRLTRFIRSLRARGYNLAMPIEKFGQLILDLTAIHGIETLLADDGTVTRAYIRPSAGSGVGPWGVSLPSGYFIDSSVLVFRWGSYFPDAVRIDQEGARAVITGVRRTFPIIGKHASNYGAAATDGALARVLKYDELIYLAPYCLKEGSLDFNLKDFSQVIHYGVLADGPGEELIAVLKDGVTLIYPPMRVNRLGGTVLDYIVRYLAPSLGFKVVEQDITLEQLRRGEIVGLAFVGNAVKVTPIGKIDIVKPLVDAPHGEKVEILFEAKIHPSILKIRDQFLAELSGRQPPAHESLLTPVDLAWGKEFRADLDDFWGRLGLL